MWSFTAFKTNSRSPFSSIYFDDHKGAHFFKDLVSVVYVGFDQVQLEISDNCAAKNNLGSSNLFNNNLWSSDLLDNNRISLFYKCDLGCHYNAWCAWQNAFHVKHLNQVQCHSMSFDAHTNASKVILEDRGLFS